MSQHHSAQMQILLVAMVKMMFEDVCVTCGVPCAVPIPRLLLMIGRHVIRPSGTAALEIMLIVTVTSLHVQQVCWFRRHF